MKIRVLFPLLLFAAIVGCSAKKQAVQEPVKEPVAQEPVKQPFTEVPPADTASQKPSSESQDARYTGSKGPVSNVWGWRVQIFASATLENARKVAEEARWKFGDQQVYLSENEPYYKVQVGNNLTRQDADSLKKKAKALGYKGVFVVEVNLAE